MPIGAVLDQLELSSPQVRALAEFYSRSFGYEVTFGENGAVCAASARVLRLTAGPANKLLGARFRFPTLGAFNAFAAGLHERNVRVRRSESGVPTSLSVFDPDGRELHFRVDNDEDEKSKASSDARMQHFAVRSPDPDQLVEFYAEKLGFTVSDFVRDDENVLRAAFLRSDDEHHVLAIFRAAESCFDHFSCEVADWTALRDWADRMASVSVPLAWGVGRHGPGNDTFFMVKDPDGNLVEISAELEVCAPERPVGLWPHRAETLNQWGVAIMRS
jgi:catechol 2,3-dioxygenase-like lactoylglutathione lyase family enzyme